MSERVHGPRCFVIGHPIAHSRSPLIHGHWLKRYSLKGSYERFDIAPDALPDFVSHVRTGQFLGGNVTVPHKVAIMPLLDDVSDAAKAIGAVNTLYFEGAKLVGDNTDGTGFLAHLDSVSPGWPVSIRTALVLGAGGAARAVVYGLKSRGVENIHITNRSGEKAADLARMTGPTAKALPWNDRHEAVETADLIVNTTSLGMRGQPPLDLHLDHLRAGTHVYDIVYVPLMTPFLRQAKARGAVPIDGLGMLLHQAAPGFSRWFGTTPIVTNELRTEIIADLEATR